MYKGDAEITMTPQQRTDLEAFIRRGGGFVAFHDSICVSNTDQGAEWFANTVSGGVKRHGFRGGPKTHGQSDRHRAPGRTAVQNAD